MSSTNDLAFNGRYVAVGQCGGFQRLNYGMSKPAFTVTPFYKPRCVELDSLHRSVRQIISTLYTITAARLCYLLDDNHAGDCGTLTDIVTETLKTLEQLVNFDIFNISFLFLHCYYYDR